MLLCFILILGSRLGIGMINLYGELCTTKAEFSVKVGRAVLIFRSQIMQKTLLRLCHGMCLDRTILIHFQIHIITKIQTTLAVL